MRRSLPIFLLLAALLVWPRAVGAMPPPASLRWILLNSTGNNLGYLIFHSTTATNAFVAQNARWTPGGSVSGLPTLVSERNTGQSISLSFIFWSPDGSRLTGVPDDGQPRLRAQFGVPQLTAPAAAGATIGAPSSVVVTARGNPAVSNTSSSPATLVRQQFPFLDRNNGDLSEIVVTATWNNLQLPSGVNESNACVQFSPEDSELGREVNGVWSSQSGVAGLRCFTLKAPTNLVQVESGDVAAGNLRGISTQSTLQFTSTNGQVLVNGQNWDRCGQFSALPNACSAATRVLPDSSVSNRLNAGFGAAAQAAKRVAIIGRRVSAATVPTELATMRNAWLYPRGEVLYVDGPLTVNSQINVNGKKLVIARDSISLQSVTSASDAQVAFVSLNGDISISGTVFQGAAIAVGSGRAINLAGTNQLSVKGLLSAPSISFVGRTSTDGIIAKLNYDARFARGELLGLSSILKPLVIEPAL